MIYYLEATDKIYLLVGDLVIAENRTGKVNTLFVDPYDIETMKKYFTFIGYL